MPWAGSRANCGHQAESDEGRDTSPTSPFQVELVAQPIGNGFDHLAAVRVRLRPVAHDRDLPRVLIGHDRDGQVRRPFANVFHLQPDRGLEFFAGFRWLLQVSIAIWPRNWIPALASV